MRTSQLLLVLVFLAIAGCSKQSTAHWIEQLKSPDLVRRIEAVHTLEQRKGAAAAIVPALMDALGDQDSHVRRDAARALGTFGNKARSAIPTLRITVRDREPAVRRAAGIALARIDPNLADSADKSGHLRRANR